MLLKVKYQDEIARNDRAVLLLVSENEVWFPLSAIQFCQGMYFTISDNFAIKKGVFGRPLYHKPNVIEPIYGQDPINELRYNSKRGDR